MKLLVVAGCLSQRYADELPKRLPEVDLFVGTADFSRLPSLIDEKLSGRGARNDIRQPNELVYSTTPRIPLTPPYTRFVKVSEGCSHSCSFCTIPLMRGGLMSRPVDDVIREMEMGIANGVREFNMVAQDLNEYGRDLASRESLFRLLERCNDLEGDFWIRLLYLYPLHFPDRLIRLMKGHRHIVPYVDIPLQHIDDTILSSMKRGSSSRYIHRLIGALKTEIPGIILRTTFIVGYPGENDSQFERLLEFVRDVEFDRLGTFLYSVEEGTGAASLPGQIPADVKEERRDLLMNLQREISLKKNGEWVGKKMKVLYEGEKPHPFKDGTVPTGRFYGQAPEIDGSVLLSANGGKSVLPRPGDFIDVRVTEAFEYDLAATIL